MKDVCCPRHGKKLNLSKRFLPMLGSKPVIITGKCPDCSVLYVGKHFFSSCNRIQVNNVWYEYLPSLASQQTELDMAKSPKLTSQKGNRAEQAPPKLIIRPKKIVPISGSENLEYCPNDKNNLICLSSVNVYGLLIHSVYYCSECETAYIQEKVLNSQFELHTINSNTALFNVTSAQKCIFDGGDLFLAKYLIDRNNQKQYSYPKKCKICNCFYFSQHYSRYFHSINQIVKKRQPTQKFCSTTIGSKTDIQKKSNYLSSTQSGGIIIADKKNCDIKYQLCFTPNNQLTCRFDGSPLTPCSFMLMCNCDFSKISAKICTNCKRLFLDFPLTHYRSLASFSANNSSSYAIKMLTPVSLEKIFSSSSSVQSTQKSEIKFDSPRRILYICKGTISCTRKNHPIESATGILVGRNDRIIRININHCRQCDQYFLGYAEYRHYRDLYGILLGNLTVTSSGSFSGRYSSMADESPLKLCGYNVSQSDNLTPEERQSILKYLIDHNILAKPQIIDYLNFFINQNQNRSNMEEAVRRWKEDLSWVRNYRILKQNQFFISDIKRY